MRSNVNSKPIYRWVFRRIAQIVEEKTFPIYTQSLLYPDEELILKTWQKTYRGDSIDAKPYSSTYFFIRAANSPVFDGDLVRRDA